MVEPSKRKQISIYLKDTFKSSYKLICETMSISRSTVYYESKIDDEQIIAKLNIMAELLPTRGFDEYFYRIREEGYKWNRKRVLRVYRELGLVRRKKPRKRLPEELRKPLEQSSGLNEVWSMDFMSDSLIDGRTFRTLNVIDDYNRECLLGKGSITFPSLRVIRELEELIAINGKPKSIRTDNGPEFISKEYKEWCAQKGIQRIYSNPGRPMENGYIERFNRTFREDILDAYLFSSIRQFNVLAEKIIEDYNTKHPHKSLGRKSPRKFAARPQPFLGFIKPRKGC